MLGMSPQETYPIVEQDTLPSIYQCAVSPLLSSAMLDVILDLFRLLVVADPPIANRVIPGLTTTWEKTSSGSAVNTGRSIGAVVQAETSLVAGTVSEFAKTIKVLFTILPSFMMMFKRIYIAETPSRQSPRRARITCSGRNWPFHVRAIFRLLIRSSLISFLQ